MRLMVLGVNHHTANVELRERLAVDGQRLDQMIGQLRDAYPLAEVVVLSTCNRTELYVARPAHEPPTTDALAHFMAKFCGVDAQVLSKSLIHFENEQAVDHLFRVACGLESMVLGEPQILGQIKRAYEAAGGLGAVGDVLHRVFQKAIAVGKRVRTETGIDSGRVSVGSAAVDFARQIFERFHDKTIVGIGAGEMAKPTLWHLMQLRPAKLWLTNRSMDKAERLASRMGLIEQGGAVRPFDQLDEMLVETDIVLTCTGATTPIITAQRFKPLHRRRKLKPLFLLDLAVPRDVEPAVGQFRNVYLYNLDDLQRVVTKTYDQRSDHAQTCEAILCEEVKVCMSAIQNRDVGQMVRALRRRLHDLGRVEQQRTQRKLATSRPEDLPALIEEHTHRLINKILHLPLSQFDHRRPGANLGFYAAALRKLFGLGDVQASIESQAEVDTDVGAGATPDQPTSLKMAESIDLADEVPKPQRSSNQMAG